MRTVLTILLISLVLGLSANAALKDDLKILEKYSIDNDQNRKVENYIFDLTYGRVYLDSGAIYLTGEWRKKPTAAFFIGHGRFEFYPPDKIEAQQVQRYYDSDSVDYAFDYAYFAFPTGSEVFANLGDEKSDLKLNYLHKRIFKHSRELPDREFYYYLPFQIYKSTLEGNNDYIFADFISGEYKHTIYSYSPDAEEPVSLYRMGPGYKKPAMVSSWSDKPSQAITEISVTDYDVTVDISTYVKSDISCKMTVAIETDSLKAVSFTIPDEYKIDSINGAVDEFMKRNDRAEFHITLDKFYHAGDTLELEVFYRVNMFYHIFNFGVIQMNLTSWLPYYGYRQLSMYDVKYSIDNGYSFVSVGKLEADKKTGDKRRLRFKSEAPVAYVSFNYGVFDTLFIEHDNVPIRLYYNRRHSSPVFGKNNVHDVAEDIGDAFDFYNENIAQYRFDRLDIDAMAVGYGQGSPGVVHLSEITFDRSTDGIDDKFRAHEVAHQWWGHIVSPKTYRDGWISEGFAEFSAAMYVLKRKKDPNTFEDILRNWKSHINGGGRLFGRNSIGYRAGSVTLGIRLRSYQTPGDYDALVYYKGAYILNMLRYELIAMYGKDRIMELLSDFANQYYNKSVCTEDFKKIVATYLKERTDQFFDQWVYGWKIPRILKDVDIEDDVATIKLDVSEVVESFTTAYPIRIIFKDNSFVDYNYYLVYGENEFRYRDDNDRAIKKIELNPNLDILEL